MNIKRIVCWFSCGSTSAVATKLTIEKYKDQYPIVVAYCDTGSEHPDNKRFLLDCEKWFGLPVTILQNPKYHDIYDVYKAFDFIVNKNIGYKCSYELKKVVRRNFEDLDGDLQIFGFDSKEKRRADRFEKNNPEVTVEFPLIEKNISKSDCIHKLMSVGIEIPMMYKLGYINNNCIGCVRGAKGYWNKIRRDFPDVFEKMAKEERRLGFALNQKTENGEMRRIFLDELDPEDGNYKSELPIQCGLFCGEL